MRYICFLISLLAGRTSFAQTDSIYRFAEKMPYADYDKNEYLAKNLQYPDSAAAKGIEGRVIVEFVVRKDGKIDNCVVKRGIGGGCDEEALRVLKNMPPWVAGMNNGQAVSVYFTLPVTFKIEAANEEATIPVEVKKDIIEPARPAYDLDVYFARNGNYPAKVKAKGIRNVAMELIINDSGFVVDAGIFNGTGDEVDEEALRLVENMPEWLPGKKNGVAVRSKSDLVIIFSSDGQTATITENKAPKYQMDSALYDQVAFVIERCHFTQNSLKRDLENALLVAEYDVDSTGHLDEFEIVRGIDSIADKVLLEALRAMPPKRPAMKFGEPVKTTSLLMLNYSIKEGKVYLQPVKPFDNIAQLRPDQLVSGYDLNLYLMNNLRYPEDARENGVQGVVAITFIVFPDGSVCGARITKKAAPLLDQEALRIVNAMPRWKPHYQTNFPPFLFTMPISFKLEEDETTQHQMKMRNSQRPNRNSVIKKRTTLHYKR